MAKRIRRNKEGDIEDATRIINAAERGREQLIKRFIGSRGWAYQCSHGFDIRLEFYDGRPQLGISLDQLDKKTIIKLVKASQLSNELLFLFELAHLPFARAYRMHLVDVDLDVYIVDRISIDLSEAFNVFDKKKWNARKFKALLKANELINMYLETEPFYAQLLESIKQR